MQTNERRNSQRLPLNNIWVREENGDYLFSFEARDVSEEGIYLKKRAVNPGQEPFSKFSLTLPGGKALKNLTGRIVWEQRGEGSAVQFLNLSESARIELKKYVAEQLLKASA